MIDRQSNIPGRVKITWDDGAVQYGIMERADEPTAEGTPLNKGTLFNSENEERYDCDLPSSAFALLGRDIEVTVPASGWSSSVDSDGYYTNRVAVAGMSAAHSPVFALEISSASQIIAEENAFGNIKRVTTEEGYTVFKADSAPDINLKIRLKGV